MVMTTPRSSDIKPYLGQHTITEALLARPSTVEVLLKHPLIERPKGSYLGMLSGQVPSGLSKDNYMGMAYIKACLHVLMGHVLESSYDRAWLGGTALIGYNPEKAIRYTWLKQTDGALVMGPFAYQLGDYKAAMLGYIALHCCYATSDHSDEHGKRQIACVAQAKKYLEHKAPFTAREIDQCYRNHGDFRLNLFEWADSLRCSLMHVTKGKGIYVQQEPLDISHLSLRREDTIIRELPKEDKPIDTPKEPEIIEDPLAAIATSADPFAPIGAPRRPKAAAPKAETLPEAPEIVAKSVADVKDAITDDDIEIARKAASAKSLSIEDIDAARRAIEATRIEPRGSMEPKRKERDYASEGWTKHAPGAPMPQGVTSAIDSEGNIWIPPLPKDEEIPAPGLLLDLPIYAEIKETIEAPEPSLLFGPSASGKTSLGIHALLEWMRALGPEHEGRLEVLRGDPSVPPEQWLGNTRAASGVLDYRFGKLTRIMEDYVNAKGRRYGLVFDELSRAHPRTQSMLMGLWEVHTKEELEARGLLVPWDDPQDRYHILENSDHVSIIVAPAHSLRIKCFTNAGEKYSQSLDLSDPAMKSRLTGGYLLVDYPERPYMERILASHLQITPKHALIKAILNVFQAIREYQAKENNLSMTLNTRHLIHWGLCFKKGELTDKSWSQSFLRHAKRLWLYQIVPMRGELPDQDIATSIENIVVGAARGA